MPKTRLHATDTRAKPRQHEPDLYDNDGLVGVDEPSHSTHACVDTWLTDFRGDLPRIDLPTLVVHGTADRILPFAATAARLRDENLITDLTVVAIENGPHNIGWTHPEETNAAMLEFLGGEAKADTAPAAAISRCWTSTSRAHHARGGLSAG